MSYSDYNRETTRILFRACKILQHTKRPQTQGAAECRPDNGNVWAPVLLVVVLVVGGGGVGVIVVVAVFVSSNSSYTVSVSFSHIV